MPGDIIIERLDLEGILQGVHPILQQALFAVILVVVAELMPLTWFAPRFLSLGLGFFLGADILVSRTVGWKKILFKD